MLPDATHCTEAGVGAYLGGIDVYWGLGCRQQGDIELLWDVRDGWNFVVIWASRVQDTFRGIVQLFSGVKAHALDKRTFDLKWGNSRLCETVCFSEGLYLPTMAPRKQHPAKGARTYLPDINGWVQAATCIHDNVCSDFLPKIKMTSV